MLIEWKYTESYSSTSLVTSARGTDRTRTYAPLFARENCPLSKELLPDFDVLFYEPFYQLMRQQFLAHEMEKAYEKGADRVSCLHIAPVRNTEFTRVTSPKVRSLGRSVSDVWQKLVRSQDRFRSVSTEDLFGRFDAPQFSDLGTWWEYINSRYSWLKQS